MPEYGLNHHFTKVKFTIVAKFAILTIYIAMFANKTIRA